MKRTRFDGSQGNVVAKYYFVALTNPAEGREQEFDEWYTNNHIVDVMRVKGFVAAQRFKLADRQRKTASYQGGDGETAAAGTRSNPYSYMAIYEIETDDLDAVMSEFEAKVNTPEIPISGAMKFERMTSLFEPITPRVLARS